MKLNQYCSVCKKNLDMDVIPTDDGGDDGVIWLRCPECQGFLPKFSADGYKPEARTAEAEPEPAPDEPTTVAEPASTPEPELAPVADPVQAAPDPDLEPEPEPEPEAADDADPEPEPEPIAEYAAMLAELDPAAARPYRPTQSYEVGTLIHHLAYDDFGVVVAKEDLPGGRKVLKTFFEKAGIVRLIEQASDSR